MLHALARVKSMLWARDLRADLVFLVISISLHFSTKDFGSAADNKRELMEDI